MRIFDNLLKLLILKAFLECFGYNFSYLPKLNSGLELVSFCCIFSDYFLHENLPSMLPYQLTKFRYQVFFTLQDIKQFRFFKFMINLQSVFKDNMGQSIQEWTKWNFSKAVFNKFHLVHYWILCPIWKNVMLTNPCFYIFGNAFRKPYFINKGYKIFRVHIFQPYFRLTKIL